MAPRTVTFKLDDRVLEVLDTYARLHGLTRSEVIRAAIIEKLRSEGYPIPQSPPVPYPDRPYIEVEVEA